MAAHPLKLIYNKKTFFDLQLKKICKAYTYRKTHHKMLKAQELQRNIDQIFKKLEINKFCRIKSLYQLTSV